MNEQTNETLDPQWICMTCKTVIGPIVDDYDNKCKCSNEYSIDLWRVTPVSAFQRLHKALELEYLLKHSRDPQHWGKFQDCQMASCVNNRALLASTTPKDGQG